MEGVIVGGLGFLHAAYLVVWLGLLAYGTYLYVRLGRTDEEPK